MFSRSLLLTDDDLQRIEDAALRILAEAGMRFESEQLLDYLEAGGARIDPARYRAFLSEEMVGRTLEALKPPTEEHDVARLVSREMGEEFSLDFGYEAFFLYDWPQKDRRGADESDIIQLIKLGDVIPEVGTVGLPVLNSKTDQRIEALEAVALLLRYTGKHRGAGIRTPAQVPYMIEIDQLLGYTATNPHFVQTGRCMISPLSFGADACGIFEALIDNGYDKSLWVATMPIAGGTSPVTAAGTVVVLVAEVIGGWVLAKCINPEAVVEASIISGAMDMRRVSASFAAPEALLQDIATAEFFRRRYGIKVGYEPGYIDAKVPGLQAAYEKTYKQMALGLCLGPALTVGGLEGCATFSPTQAMLEIDLNQGLWRFFQGIDCSDERLATDEIITACNADLKSFMQTDHTLDNYREALWDPEFLLRGPWTDGATEWTQANSLLDAADEKWRELLKQYEAPEVDEDQLREVEGIIDRARAELCG